MLQRKLLQHFNILEVFVVEQKNNECEPQEAFYFVDKEKNYKPSGFLYRNFENWRRITATSFQNQQKKDKVTSQKHQTQKKRTKDRNQPNELVKINFKDVPDQVSYVTFEQFSIFY